MRRHATDTVVTSALRHLDPAPSADLTEAEGERADAAFARIVATPSDEPVPVEAGRPHRRRSRLLVTLGLAGAAGVAIPGLLLGGGNAYGSWTPRPASLTDVDAAAAATTCRAALDVPDRGERVAVAERRGEWTYVLLAGPGTEAVCLMPDDLVGQDPSAPEDFFGSYDTDTIAPPTVAPGRIDETSSMQGSTEEGWFIWVEGYVGRGVSGVTVHTSLGPDIEASVTGNRFAAWWPTSRPSSDHPAETWSFTVHLAEGAPTPRLTSGPWRGQVPRPTSDGLASWSARGASVAVGAAAPSLLSQVGLRAADQEQRRFSREPCAVSASSDEVETTQSSSSASTIVG